MDLFICVPVFCRGAPLLCKQFCPSVDLSVGWSVGRLKGELFTFSVEFRVFVPNGLTVLYGRRQIYIEDDG